MTNEVLTVTKSGISPVDILLPGNKSIKHAFDKQLKIRGVPGQDQDPSTWLIDLKILLETFTITGVLLDESDDSAVEKKSRIRSIMQSQGTMRIKWDDTDPNQWSGGAVDSGSFNGYEVNIIKAEISESPGTIGDEEKVKFYDIIIIFAFGLNKG